MVFGLADVMRRLLDASVLQGVLDRPEVAPMVNGFDPASWLADTNNVALADDGNVMLFERRGARLYEAHILFRARGAPALRIAGAMLGAMFDIWSATAIYALPPSARRDVKWFARRMGFVPCGASVDRPMGKCDIFALRADQRRD